MVTPAEPVLKQKSQDMGSLRAPKSKAGGAPQHMDAFEVLKQYFTKTYGPQQIDQFMDQFARLVKSGSIQLVQIGDTVFGVMKRSNNTAEFYIATVEPVLELPKRVAALSKTLKNMGFKRAVSSANTPNWEQLYKQAGVPVQTSKVQYNIFGSNVPKFQFSWDLT